MQLSKLVKDLGLKNVENIEDINRIDFILRDQKYFILQEGMRLTLWSDSTRVEKIVSANEANIADLLKESSKIIISTQGEDSDEVLKQTFNKES